MPKHIKLKCVLSDDRTVAVVTILEQTHFHTEFGDLTLPRVPIITHGVDFCYKDVRVVSHALNIPYAISIHSISRGTELTCYLLGHVGQNPCYFKVLAEEWPRIKTAVEAYNEYFKE